MLKKSAWYALRAFDGDVDRLVYYYIDASGAMKLLDGDKIACLLGGFVKKQLDALPDETRSTISLGVVQTAYANGASTKYMRETFGIEPVLAKTGVKNCHHRALDFDIGCYFKPTVTERSSTTTTSWGD